MSADAALVPRDGPRPLTIDWTANGKTQSISAQVPADYRDDRCATPAELQQAQQNDDGATGAPTTRSAADAAKDLAARRWQSFPARPSMPDNRSYVNQQREVGAVGRERGHSPSSNSCRWPWPVRGLAPKPCCIPPVLTPGGGPPGWGSPMRPR